MKTLLRVADALQEARTNALEAADWSTLNEVQFLVERARAADDLVNSAYDALSDAERAVVPAPAKLRRPVDVDLH